MGVNTNAYRVFVGMPGGARPLERHRGDSEDNIKIDLRELVEFIMDLINMAQDRDQWRIPGTPQWDRIVDSPSNCWLLKGDSTS
jgi:hypothetical protein